MPVPFYEIIEQQSVNVLKHTYPWLLSVRKKTYLQGVLTFFKPTARLGNPHLFLILILTRFIKMICSFHFDVKRHWALVNIKVLIRQETPPLLIIRFTNVSSNQPLSCSKMPFYQLLSEILFYQFIISLFCSHSNIVSLSTMTCFLMIASGSLVISRCKVRALDQIQLKSNRKPFDRASLHFLNKTLQISKYFRAGLIFKL